jgi:hypothetical protein
LLLKGWCPEQQVGLEAAVVYCAEREIMFFFFFLWEKGESREWLSCFESTAMAF